MFGDKIMIQTAPEALKVLWAKKFFEKERTFHEIKKEVGKLGCNPPDPNLRIALIRAKYLTRRGSKGDYLYIQRYSPKEIVLNEDILPEKLIAALGEEFKTEINDLKLNFGRSGTCTAFLLRKILEKLIFLAFAKNGVSNKLRNKNGNFVGLKTMLNMATICKVHGKPFLMPKTAKEIEGIKFLGDTSAHNPLVNVDMKTIIPVIPFIVTAYDELSKKL